VPCCGNISPYTRAVLCSALLCRAVLPSPAKTVRIVLVLTRASSTLSLFIMFALQQQVAIDVNTSHN
jgi:hypothetical protein